MKDEKIILEEIRNIYEIVRNQMFFAESKNATVLVFNAAALAFFLQNNFNKGFVSAIAIIAASAACILGVLSFHPLKYDTKHFAKIDKDNSSLIYFRNIASYKTDEYLRALYKNFSVDYNPNNSCKMVYDYAEEIMVISNITIIKNDIFSISMLSTVVSIVCMIITIL